MIQSLDPASLTAFVTGVTSGFGRSLAKRYVEAGAPVARTGRRGDRLQELKGELGERFQPVTHGFLCTDARLAAVEALPCDLREINLPINNAGLALVLEPAHEITFDGCDSLVDTYVKGLLHYTDALLPGLIECDEGQGVNL